MPDFLSNLIDISNTELRWCNIYILRMHYYVDQQVMYIEGILEWRLVMFYFNWNRKS